MENYGILLVDDEPAYHAIVSALLAARGGRVDGADSIATALEAVRSRRYDLVLVDINLAADDGYVAVGHLRATADWARIAPILAFTTEHLSGGERHYVDAGFDGWLPKPFQAAELIVTLQRWLGAERVGPITVPSEDKLAAVIGEEAARGMIDRFHAGIAEAIRDIDAGGDERAIGHRLGGLAGMLGYRTLSAAWLALEEEGRSVWPTVRTLALEAIARHDVPRPGGGSDIVGA